MVGRLDYFGEDTLYMVSWYLLLVIILLYSGVLEYMVSQRGWGFLLIC